MAISLQWLSGEISLNTAADRLGITANIRNAISPMGLALREAYRRGIISINTKT